jgi:hypothetical protein
MTPQQFLISKGFNPDAIQHPNDRDSINGYINLFEIMEEYALTKQTGTNTLVMQAEAIASAEGAAVGQTYNCYSKDYALLAKCEFWCGSETCKFAQ